jgi:hypothetical protein
MTPKPDYELERVREARMQISAEFNHDPELLVKHYMELQKRHKDRLVRPPKASAEELAKDAD